MRFSDNPIKGTIGEQTPREILIWNIYHHFACIDFSTVILRLQHHKRLDRQTIDSLYHDLDRIIFEIETTSKYLEILHAYDLGVAIVE